MGTYQVAIIELPLPPGGNIPKLSGRVAIVKGKTAGGLHMLKAQAHAYTVRTKVTIHHLAKGPHIARHLPVLCLFLMTP